MASALRLLGKGQTSLQRPKRGGAKSVEVLVPPWRSYRPENLRIKMVGYWEGTETERAAFPFPFPPVLHSCPSPLVPLSPASYLFFPSHAQEEQALTRLTR